MATQDTSHQSVLVPLLSPPILLIVHFCTSLREGLHRTCGLLALQSQLAGQVLTRDGADWLSIPTRTK